jgi:hypothetical protein
MITIQSNIQEWADFFKRYAVEHPKLKGSALGSNINLNYRMVNTAFTLGKDGKEFQYFKAVDTGRRAIDAEEFVLTFAGRGGEQVFREHVNATTGAEITAKSEGVARGKFYAEVGSILSRWALTANEDSILSTGLQVASVDSEQTPIAVGSKAEGTPYDNVVLQLINKSKTQFNPNIGKFGAIPSGASPGVIQKLIKIPNWYAISAIFTKATGDQIESVWKPNTPSRKDEEKYKLAYVKGGELTMLDPSTGGGLRNGYRLIHSVSMGKLIND